MDVPLDHIDPPANVQLNQSSIDKMVTMLQKQGLPKPILVHPVDDRYTILDGTRRYLAAKQLGWETIAVRVQEQHQPPSDPLITEIAQTLNEPNVVLVKKVVQTLGSERARAYLQQTLDIEAQGGMMTIAGQQRRTPGGVFFYLIRKGVSQQERQAIFPYTSQRKKPDSPAPPKKPAKPQVEPLTWPNALKYVNALFKHPKGEVKTVEVKLIGRPTKVAKAESCMVAMMEGKSASKSLPKGLPAPPEQVLTFAVFISNKHWAKVSDDLKANATAELLVKGHPVFNPEKAMTILLAQEVEVIERKPKQQKEQQHSRGTP